MLRQIVIDEESLRKLLRKEIRKRAAPKFETTEEEVDAALDNFFKETKIKKYPVFIQFEVMFVFRGMNVNVIFSSCIMTKEEMQLYLNVFNNL